MKLKCFGSSSRGNGYILEGRNQSLMIEAGVPLYNYLRGGVEFSKVVGCLVSHRHGDHSKYMKDVAKIGIPFCCNDDVWEHYQGLQMQRIDVKDLEEVTIGEFTIKPFPAIHDVQCWSYLVYHEEMGKLLFVTDSQGCGFSFSDIDHVMIECNWSEELIQQALEDGRTNTYVANRSRETHMGIDDCKDVLKEDVIMDKVKEVILLHLSHEHSDPYTFSTEIEKAAQKPVFVAQNGFTIELTTTDNGNNNDNKE